MYYFRIYAALVVLGAAHGLVLLPVLLSVFGPEALDHYVWRWTKQVGAGEGAGQGARGQRCELEGRAERRCRAGASLLPPFPCRWCASTAPQIRRMQTERRLAQQRVASLRAAALQREQELPEDQQAARQALWEAQQAQQQVQQQQGAAQLEVERAP